MYQYVCALLIILLVNNVISTQKSAIGEIMQFRLFLLVVYIIKYRIRKSY